MARTIAPKLTIVSDDLPPADGAPPRKPDALATCVLVLGIASCLFAGVALGPVAMICGVTALEPPPAGNQGQVSIGELVFAVGDPLHFRTSLARGAIASVRLLEGTVPPVKVFQSQVPFNPGNSGGVLCRETGEFIGVNSWTIRKDKAEGLGFSISIENLEGALAGAPAELVSAIGAWRRGVAASSTLPLATPGAQGSTVTAKPIETAIPPAPPVHPPSRGDASGSTTDITCPRCSAALSVITRPGQPGARCPLCGMLMPCLARIFHGCSQREGGDCAKSRCLRWRAGEGVLKHIEVVRRENALRLPDIRTRSRRSVKFAG